MTWDGPGRCHQAGKDPTGLTLHPNGHSELTRRKQKSNLRVYEQAKDLRNGCGSFKSLQCKSRAKHDPMGKKFFPSYTLKNLCLSVHKGGLLLTAILWWRRSDWATGRWVVSLAVSAALRILTLHPTTFPAWGLNANGDHIRSFHPKVVEAGNHLLTCIVELRGILRMVPTSSSSFSPSWRATIGCSPWVQSWSRAESSSWWGNGCSCTGKGHPPGR